MMYTGDSFKSLMYLFRVHQSTISKIIPEVCAAIYSALKDDFLKVKIKIYLIYMKILILNLNLN